MEEGLDITLSCWAEVIRDENYQNIQIHADRVIQEIREKFPSTTISRSRKCKTRLKMKNISDAPKAFDGATQHESQAAQR